MHIKKGLIIKEIDNEYVLIDSGIEPPLFNGLIKVNKVGKVIIELLMNNDYSYDELIKELLDRYDTDEDTLKASINPFLDELRNAKLLYE